jgi:hypothetical protein
VQNDYTEASLGTDLQGKPALIPIAKSRHRRIGYLRNRRSFYTNQSKAFTHWLREQTNNLKTSVARN